MGQRMSWNEKPGLPAGLESIIPQMCKGGQNSIPTHTHTEDLPPGAHHPSPRKSTLTSGSRAWGSQSREKSPKIRVRPLTQEAAGTTDLSGRSGKSADVGSVDRGALSQPSLDLNSGTAPYELCDLGLVTQPLRAYVLSSIKWA